MDVWEPVTAVGTVAAAVVAAYAARQSKDSASKAEQAARISGEAATTLAQIERDRRHDELTPRFRVGCEPWEPGSEDLRLRLTLLGPAEIQPLKSLYVIIRDDRHRRAEHPLAPGGPTPEQIKEHVSGPYRLTPGAGLDNQRVNANGAFADCSRVVPVGEELQFRLEPTQPPPWATGTSLQDWRLECGSVLRLEVVAFKDGFSLWSLWAELDLHGAAGIVTVELPRR